MLLGPSRDVGPEMAIGDFCAAFGLSDDVLEKLKENAYDIARHLQYVSLENLTEMKFKLGERAALQDAVEHWSIPRT